MWGFLLLFFIFIFIFLSFYMITVLKPADSKIYKDSLKTSPGNSRIYFPKISF